MFLLLWMIWNVILAAFWTVFLALKHDEVSIEDEAIENT